MVSTRSRRWRDLVMLGLVFALLPLLAKPVPAAVDDDPLMISVSASAAQAGEPSDGAWIELAPSQTNRQESGFVHLDGKMYLGGGATTHEVYDPATDSWSSLAPLPANLDHIQSVTVDGLIYYIGGLSSWPGGNAATVYIYDPATDTFATGQPMPNGGQGAGGVAVHDGIIYYAGGTRGTHSGGTHGADALDEFLAYDPVADSWTSLPPMPRARDHFHAVVTGGKFWAIGGRNVAINATTGAVDAYDLATGTWETRAGSLPTPRGGFASGVLGDEILIIGGEGGGKTYGQVEAYDITADTWRSLAPMPTPRHGIQAAACNGGLHIASGGTTQGGGNPSTVHEAFFLDGPTSCPAGAEGSLTADPGALDFGEVQTGASVAETVTLTNTGTSALSVSDAPIEGDVGAFAVTTALPIEVPAGASTALEMAFTPDTAGRATATMSLEHTASNETVMVELSGEGTAAAPGPGPDDPATIGELLVVCDDPENAFPDDDGTAHESAIDCLAALGLFAGYADGTVGPGDDVTRGQVAGLMSRLVELVSGQDLEELCPDGGEPLPDGGATFGDAIACMNQLGIVEGYPDGTYRPGRAISRAQGASLLARTAEWSGYELPAPDLSGFDDVAPGDTHAIAIGGLTGLDVFRGYADGRFGPSDPITRGQLGSAIERLLRSFVEFPA